MNLTSCFETQLDLACFTGSNYSEFFHLIATTGNVPVVNEQEWNEIVARINYRRWLNEYIENLLICCISLLGINGAVLTISTLHCKSYMDRRMFYILMNVGCAADFVFNLVGLPLYYLRTAGYDSARHSFVLMEVIRIGRPLIYTMSQFSDFTVVLLALERYLSLCRSIHRHSVPTQRKTHRFIGMLLPAFAISCMRFYYIRQYLVASSESPKVDDGQSSSTTAEIYDLQPDPFGETWEFHFLCLFNDGIIPLLMVVATMYFSVCVVRVVHRRSSALQLSLKMGLFDGIAPVFCRSSSARSSTSQARTKLTANKLVRKQEKLNRNRNMIALILITSFGFYVNQAINVVTTVIMVWEKISPHVTMRSSRNEVFDWLESALRMNGVDVTLNIFDCLSHSMNFYAYVAFNRTFRHEFIGIIFRLRLVNMFCPNPYDTNKSET